MLFKKKKENNIKLRENCNLSWRKKIKFNSSCCKKESNKKQNFWKKKSTTTQCRKKFKMVEKL